MDSSGEENAVCLSDKGKMKLACFPGLNGESWFGNLLTCRVGREGKLLHHCWLGESQGHKCTVQAQVTRGGLLNQKGVEGIWTRKPLKVAGADCKETIHPAKMLFTGDGLIFYFSAPSSSSKLFVIKEKKLYCISNIIVLYCIVLGFLIPWQQNVALENGVCRCTPVGKTVAQLWCKVLAWPALPEARGLQKILNLKTAFPAERE